MFAGPASVLNRPPSRLDADEAADLRSQNATSSAHHGGRRYPPFAFTEHGAIMAATILNSPLAVEISVFVVRAFVKLREMVVTHKELARKLTELEQKVGSHDTAIRQLIEAIRQLMMPPSETKPRRRIGFGREQES